MPSNRTAFYHDELCMWHSTGEAVLFLPLDRWLQPMVSGGHPESPESKRRFKSLLDVSGMSGKLPVLSADPATDEDLHRVHDADYIARFKQLSAASGGEIGPEALFSRGGFEIACLSAGLAKRAVDDVLSGQVRNAYALSRPPGHHCGRDEGMGFCLLANIAIAIEAARAKHGVDRIAVVDWDVHHGNGTQSIFYDRPDVLTLSLHQDNCFPVGSGAIDERGAAQGQGYNLNIPLPPGSGHDTYLHAIDTIVTPALGNYQPDLIIIACGLDANAADPLARQLLHSDSFRAMTHTMTELADSLCDGRLVCVHEGGYSESVVPFCGLAVIESLSGIRTAVDDPFVPIFAAQQPSRQVVEYQKTLVDGMAEFLINQP